MSSAHEILKFWFQSLNDETPISRKHPPASLWFNGGRRFDDEIRQKFLADYQRAKNGEYDDWGSNVRGRLALILIFDQFSRNMFRNTSEAFATDQKALDLTIQTQREGSDRTLMLIERVFLYMPLMHAESLDVQDQSVAAFTSLVEESRHRAPQNTSYFEYNLAYAVSHRDVIQKFGRFPHRNAVLGRPSTEPEGVFLSEGV